MQPGFTEIKTSARQTLKSHWPEAIAISVTITALSLLDIILQAILTTVFRVDTVWSVLEPTELPKYSVVAGAGITVFSALYGLLLFTPFLFGALRWFWLLIYGKDCSIGDVFYYFSSGKLFLKTVALSFLLFLRMVLGAIVCFLPYAALNLMTKPELYNAFGYSMPVEISGFFPLAYFFELAGWFLFLFWCSRFALFFVALFEQPELSANAMITYSIGLTKGKLFRLVGFFFSFLGWLLLCVLVLPVLFVIPFALASLMVYGREELRFSKTEQQNFAPNMPFYNL